MAEEPSGGFRGPRDFRFEGARGDTRQRRRETQASLHRGTRFIGSARAFRNRVRRRRVDVAEPVLEQARLPVPGAVFEGDFVIVRVVHRSIGTVLLVVVTQKRVRLPRLADTQHRPEARRAGVARRLRPGAHRRAPALHDEPRDGGGQVPAFGNAGGGLGERPGGERVERGDAVLALVLGDVAEDRDHGMSVRRVVAAGKTRRRRDPHQIDRRASRLANQTTVMRARV